MISSPFGEPALTFPLLRTLFCVAALAGFAPLTSSVAAKEWQSLRIASEGARPPYNFLDANNELQGFEIDLGYELCARLKLTCSFVAQEWDGLIPRLLANHYDAIMAAMEISEDRLKEIAFTKPYIRMPSAFMAARKRKINDSSPAGLVGRVIGVEANGPHQAFLEERYKDSTIKPFASLVEAVLDLSEGRIDVALGDKDAITDLLKTRKEAACCKYLADVPRDPAFFGEGIGIGLRKDDADLKALLEKALDEIVSDGTYARLRGKYFDFEIY